MCCLAELWASEGTNPEWEGGVLNAALDVCAQTDSCEHLATQNIPGMREHQRDKPKHPLSLQK